ncbi:MAG TPA: DUF3618 domain-containing protein [Pseudonocardiaceae bacterium]|jgi:hypothetical protein|nr:DUF3618 domain-containing protein [Pseudonocardiaceae bacterium]
MARDADTIEREIEQARDALAATLDELGTRAHPKRMIEAGKEQVEATWANPKVRYSLLAVAALIVLLLVRKLVR